MGTSSGANFNQQQTPAMLPPRQPYRSSISLASSEPVGSPDMQEHLSNSDAGHDSATESASSRETWPVANNQSSALDSIKRLDKDEAENGGTPELQVILKISSTDKLSLREVVRERVDVISEKMKVMPDELLEELKNELRMILEGTGGSHLIEEFMYLQKLLQGRIDLTASTLAVAHRVQLEVLVAIKTGIQAFLHPSVSIPVSRLVEIFLYKRCRNIACQSTLPAEECRCDICATRNGFCNLCMCVICNKFDFEVNSCRWIGCDFCSHWTHANCAMVVGQIGTGQSVKDELGHPQMLFTCSACQKASELLGWVKDVFQQCAPGWDRETLMQEIGTVCHIFRMAKDPKGRKLHWKCGELMEKLKSGIAESIASRVLLQFLQELDIGLSDNMENDEVGRLITPQEACNRIAEVVQEAIQKMEMVAEEKMLKYKRARLALDACDRELEEKAKEVQAVKMEWQRKKQQVEELEKIVSLKQHEAEMFQLKANEARQEAERLQSIALAKSEKVEDYTSMYLKRRLEEAEAEKQYLFEKIKLQESQRANPSSSNGVTEAMQSPMLSKIQDLLKNVRNLPSKSDGQQSK